MILLSSDYIVPIILVLCLIEQLCWIVKNIIDVAIEIRDEHWQKVINEKYILKEEIK
jgi:hypothetical protein